MRVTTRVVRLLPVFLAVGLGMACQDQQDRSPAESAPEVRAANSIGQSFVLDQTSNGGTSGDEVARIGIRRDALEKEFLLQTSLIGQTFFPSWNGMRSRIVAFREADGKLHMLEASDGHNLTPELPMSLLVASYPILPESTNETIYFDFNAGTNEVFLGADWNASDFMPFNEDHWTSVSMNESFISSTKFADERFIIEQVAQIDGRGAQVANLLPVRIRYSLSPYRPDPEYVSHQSTSFDRVGYFEGAARLPVSSGMPVYFATKWNDKKPIVFAISANTPAEYKQAAKDGVLYWNKVFGREVLQVIDAPAEETGPSYTHNMVQWLDFDDAGFAYADAQMDPRTGQITHAQVFMTSAFAEIGKFQAQMLSKSGNQGDSPVRLKLNGFTPSHLCHFQPQEIIQKFLARHNAGMDVRPEEMLKAGQDFVRHVVAHEIGHTLGLRHNFAGSLGSNIETEKRDETIQAYFRDGKAPAGVVTGSSVMEYSPFEESILHGDQISRGETVLTHDKVAIDQLYNGVQVSTSGPLFCTDSHVMKYLDCIPGDFGKTSVEFAYKGSNTTAAMAAKNLVSSFIVAKQPPQGYRTKTFEEVTGTTDQLATFLAGDYFLPMLLLQSDVRHLSVRRSFATENSFNETRIREAEERFLESELTRLGVSQQPLRPRFAGTGAAIAQEFTTLIEGTYRNGIGLAGQPYEFSDADLTEMKSIVTRLTEKLDDAIVKAWSKLASAQLKNLPTNQSTWAIEAEVVTLLDEVVHAKTGSMINTSIKVKEGENFITKAVSLPVFKYDFETRSHIISLLADGRSKDVTYGVLARPAAKEKLKALFDQSVGGDILTVELKGLDRDALRWVIEARKLLMGFDLPFMALAAK